VAKYRKGGFMITEIGLFARIPTPKPVFPRHRLGDREPAAAAGKGQRDVFAGGAWRAARIWDMDGLQPGNVIEGLSIVEHSMTTLVIPEGMMASIDDRGFIWLSEVSRQ
jgi:N-methylhydantoinase A